MELAREDAAYEDVASKFWEHFLYIAHAMNNRGADDVSLWDEADGFYYDVLHLPGQGSFPMKVRSMVGLIPLFAIETLEPEVLNKLPGFKKRLEWFLDNRPDLIKNVACMRTPGRDERRLLSVVNLEQLRRVLAVMLDEREFLSPRRSARSPVSRRRNLPAASRRDGIPVDYEPRNHPRVSRRQLELARPVWFPVNYCSSSLAKFHHYPATTSASSARLGRSDVESVGSAAELSRRLSQFPA